MNDGTIVTALIIAVERGRHAYWDCAEPADNPFPVGSPEHTAWAQGYQDAERQDR